MENIVTRKEIEDVLSKHLTYKATYLRAYIYDRDEIVLWKQKDPNIYLVSFRVPGATRGHIRINKFYYIEEFVFYEDVCFGEIFDCFDKEVLEDVQQFIGYKLSITDFRYLNNC